MKTSLKLIAAGVAAFYLVCIIGKSPALHAQEPVAQQVVVPVVVNSSSGHYKVLDIAQFNIAINQTAAGTLEAILNELGAHGWKVVAATGNFVILTQ